MQKRLRFLILIGALLPFVLSGCGSNPAESATPPANDQEVVISQEDEFEEIYHTGMNFMQSGDYHDRQSHFY